MTESFLSALREFLLAEAQECYWQQAVLRELPSFILHLADEQEGSYKNGLIGKLSMKVSDYYKSALAAANSTDSPSAGFFPPVSSPFPFSDLLEKMDQGG
jgi:programmed cell death 6-interacting protein